MRPLRFILLCLPVIAALLFCPIALAQDEDGEQAQPFPNSPNAQRVLTRYETALDEHAQGYHEQVEGIGQRFTIQTRRHTQRYAALLEREVRSLTQAGSFEAAQAVQAAIESASNWPITPPDETGRHFLSNETLEVTGSPTSTQHGIDLLVQVERASVLHREQIASVRELYAFAVESERHAYRASLDRVLASEQRAGRLEAVQEIRQGIDALNDLPPIQPPAALPAEGPEAGGQGGDAVAGAAPGAFPGYYIVHYTDPGQDGPRVRLLIELTEAGGIVHGQSWNANRINWSDTAWRIEIVSRERDRVVFRHNRGRNDPIVVHELVLENGRPVGDRMWWSEEDYRAEEDPLVGEVEALGSPGADLLGMSDGGYVLEMLQHQNAQGLAFPIRARFRMEVVNGIVAMTQMNIGGGDRWTPREPNVLNAESRGQTMLLTFDDRMSEVGGVIKVNASPNGTPTVEYWWTEQAFRAEAEPAMTGALIRP